jgi:hypothetical protein
MSAGDREALRQQMLLRALWQDARPGVLAGWTRDGETFAPGLQVYRANAGALAERALAAACPTLQQLLGEESFAAMARAFWHQHAPLSGDIAQWGHELPAFIAAAEQLAAEPYLADVARLEWAVHRAQTAADTVGGVAGLDALAGADAPLRVLQARPGTALLESPHPVVSIWQAHRATGPDRFDAVRQALADQRAERPGPLPRPGLRQGRAQAVTSCAAVRVLCISAAGFRWPIGSFFAVYVGVTALSLPGAAILTLAGGAVFGLGWARWWCRSPAASAPRWPCWWRATCCATACRRASARGWPRSTRASSAKGRFYLFTLRLVPLFPFFVINLLMGLTKMKAGTFYAVSQLGMLAGTLVYVNAGTQLAQISRCRASCRRGCWAPSCCWACSRCWPRRSST